MISISETSIDVAINNTLGGNLDFFIDQLPSDESYKRNALKNNKVEDYKETLLKLIDRSSRADGACHILRDELQVMFAYIVGNVPDTPNKFTSMLKHHRIHMGKVWVDAKSLAGITVKWAEPKRLDEFRETIMPTNVAPKLKAVGGRKK